MTGRDELSASKSARPRIKYNLCAVQWIHRKDTLARGRGTNLERTTPSLSPEACVLSSTAQSRHGAQCAVVAVGARERIYYVMLRHGAKPSSAAVAFRESATDPASCSSCAVTSHCGAARVAGSARSPE